MTCDDRASLGRPSLPAPTILTDGDKITLDMTGGIVHPSIYKRDPDSGIDEEEFFHWELCGYLVLRNVMDPEWLVSSLTHCDCRLKLMGYMVY